MNPPVKNPVIGIVGGRGTLGRIFRRAFETAGYKVLVSGRKPSGTKILSNKQLVKKSDVVIVSVFLKDTEQVLKEITPLLNKKQLLCDLTSVKVRPVQIMLEGKAEVVGLHPMFGEVANIAGQNIFACPMRSDKWWPWLRATLIDLGLNIHETTPTEHDELAVVHQSIPHLLSIALAIFLTRRSISPAKIFEQSSPSTRLALLTAGRLLAQDHELYRDLQFKNPASKKASAELRHIILNLGKLVEKRRGKQFLSELQNTAKHFGKWSDFALTETNKLFGRAANTTTQTHTKNSIKPKSAIAVLGPATQTELAATKFLERTKSTLKPVFLPTISEIFAAVATNKAAVGFVPLENYTIGPVRDTVKQLFNAKGKVQIIAELSRPITHSLIGQSKLKPTAVSVIFAHPQARAQCQRFLQKNFPKVEIVETPHTGESITRAALDSTTLAIGPAEFAAAQGLTVLKKGIEDDPNNRTRFIAIAQTGRSALAAQHPKRTALAFYFTRNKAGQLAAALTIFAEQGISLSRLESIPTEKKLGEFFFFTEAEANTKDKKLTIAIKTLQKLAKVVVLGSY